MSVSGVTLMRQGSEATSNMLKESTDALVVTNARLSLSDSVNTASQSGFNMTKGGNDWVKKATEKVFA